MPFETTDTGVVSDGEKQLGAELDALVNTKQITPEDALKLAQTRGLTTGPGPNSYNPPKQEADNAADLNKQSRQSAAQSAAYQASRVGNPEGYTQESQDAFNAQHPLSEY